MMLRRKFPSPFELALSVLLLSAVIGGGGPWNLFQAGLSALALWVLAWACLREFSGVARPWRRIEWSAVAIVLGLFVLNAVPLPASVWMNLAGRQDIGRELAAAGLAPGWHPLTLDPSQLLRRIGSVLPALAVFVGVRDCSSRWIRVMLLGLVAAACASVALGLAQVVDGPDSPLRLHAFDNRVGALGWFAYRNAHAAFLMMVLPFGFALLSGSLPGSPRGTLLLRSLIWLALPLLLLGLALTYSRSGIVLGALTLAGCAAIALRFGKIGVAFSSWPLLATAGVAGLMLAAYFAIPGLASRQGEALLTDARWELYATVAEYAKRFSPWGAGWGAFEQVFQTAPQNLDLMLAYFNHAHNDWLQLYLELGWLFVPLAALVLGTLARASWRVWRSPPPPSAELAAVGPAASVALLIVLLHAWFDYTLHGVSNLATCALLAGLLFKFAWPARLLPQAGSSTARAGYNSP